LRAPDAKALLAHAYELLCEAEFHLEKHGFTMGTGLDGAFLAHSERHGYNAEPQRKARAELESPQLQPRAGGAP